MSATENHGFFGLIKRLINRIFFQKHSNKKEQLFCERISRSIQPNVTSSNSIHGDEEAFWFI
ncbi:MAG: hypothetical protein V4565_13160 [Bacteroidota bacterium]